MHSFDIWSNPPGILAADASVIISLTASGFCSEILRAVPGRFIVADIVVRELDSGISAGHTNIHLLRRIIENGDIEVVRMGNSALEHFLALAAGPTRDTLDDGEAATIAAALEQGGVPLIDERKARRICDERYRQLRYGYTVDLFMHPEVEGALGRHNLSQAVLNALKNARMRVLPRDADWVIRLVGLENARECSSMARVFRERR